MPISKDEWDAGRTWETLESRILAFLRKNKGKALTVNEIYSGLGYRRTSGFLGLITGVAEFVSIHNALESLAKEGTVRAKIVKHAIGEDTYYRAT